MSNAKHRRISVETRNKNVIYRVMNEGASKTELCREYDILWNSLRDSIRNSHYHLDTNPNNKRNQNLYEQFCKQATANEAKAAARSVTSQNISKKTAITATVTSTENQPVTITTGTPTENKATLYLVESGYLLHQNFEEMLATDNGSATFYIPRFCLNELRRISESSKDENHQTKPLAKDLVMKIYSLDIWGKRIISFKPQEQGFVEKTSDFESFKLRSFGIAEAAIELFLSGDCNVVVLTNSREVELLLNDFCSRENITGIIVQRVRTFKTV